MKYKTECWLDYPAVGIPEGMPATAIKDRRALNALVDAFSKAIKAKLFKQADNGWYGWDNPVWGERAICDALHSQMDRPNPDPVDCAALAAFLWNRQSNIVIEPKAVFVKHANEQDCATFAEAATPVPVDEIKMLRARCNDATTFSLKLEGDIKLLQERCDALADVTVVQHGMKIEALTRRADAAMTDVVRHEEEIETLQTRCDAQVRLINDLMNANERQDKNQFRNAPRCDCRRDPTGHAVF